MRKATKLHKEHIEELQAEIKMLKKTNRVLEEENTALKEARIEEHALIQSLKKQYETAINDANEIKVKYKALISEAVKQKKQFEDKTGILLKRMRKQQ